jgi:hypothetical protein
MLNKSNKILTATTVLILIISFIFYNNGFAKAALYGSILSYLNILSIQFITSLFIEKKKTKIFAFISTILKILILVGIMIYLIQFLSLDLIGFLTGFSVILIVFILLIQGK